MKKIKDLHIIGGETVSHISNHLALHAASSMTNKYMVTMDGDTLTMERIPAEGRK